ncbi:hypothetical protein ACFQFG_09865 [Methylobacterium persicinum]
MEQDVGRSVVWNDEAEPLGDVEPFDPARDLYEVQGLLDLLDGLPLGEWGISGPDPRSSDMAETTYTESRRAFWP